ncbi:MAG: BON domain-containing protein [Rubrivivax sp.]|nr:BON domain-containing protein [Rubrivivax sp.]
MTIHPTTRSVPLTALAAAVTAVALLAGAGCSVMRDQQTVGTYVDDSVLTTRVKAKLADNSVVSSLALSVETFKGVVQLTGVAKTVEERQTAERLAREVSGVVGVRNDIRVSG